VDSGKLALRKLGKRIRELRRQKGWSQEQFALEVELARSYIGDVERGQRNISIVNVAKIAGCLDVTISELCQGVPSIMSSKQMANRR
jgi:transcriptional regulator with XRE-family HTH domain